jgi:sodium transport system ATP-binding protein
MIEVENLVKHYGEVKAVDGVSFKVPDGQITGLIGPNGAGKTTTLRMIAGLIRPQRGRVLVDGVDATKESQKARALLGVQSDMLGVYPRLTPREQIRYYGRLQGLRGDKLEARVEAVIEDLHMEDIADRRAEGFSRGQRQKIILGRALVHDPHNILLDEPTQGLDVMAVRETRETMGLFKAQGRAMLFSTHFMDEAERLCDHIAIIVSGKILALGTPQALLETTGFDNLEDAFVSLAGAGLVRSGEIAPEA